MNFVTDKILSVAFCLSSLIIHKDWQSTSLSRRSANSWPCIWITIHPNKLKFVLIWEGLGASLPTSILNRVNKGQLRALFWRFFFAKLAHCSFKTLGVLRFGGGGGGRDFLPSFHRLYDFSQKPKTWSLDLLMSLIPTFLGMIKQF